jgi:translation initiation factor IF-2
MPRKKSSKSAKTKTKKEQFHLKRPPVVTMLGHVDHGKTSILDAIRGTKVQSCEAGGITQNVRAHKIEYKGKSKDTYSITFIDTPGHEAFSKMRSRGAQVTDIVVLVVAVDDSVQPQTKEAIEFAKEAKASIVVALNKVDLKGVDKAKVKRELADNDVQVEELGGDVMCVETSAKKKKGLDELLEAILLTAEMKELKSKKPKKGRAEAIVLESTTDKSQGTISLCIVKAGRIVVGDTLCLDKECGKVRALKNETFCSEKEACESDPIWILGLSHEIPVGETLFIYEKSEDIKVEKIIKKTQDKKKKQKEEVGKEDGDEEDDDINKEILAGLLDASTSDESKELNVILKSESQGTLEVAESEIQDLSNDEVKMHIIDSGTGDINGDDIIKAKTVKGIVIGYKSKLSNKDARIAKTEKVLVRNYDIIYDLLDEVEEVMESMKDPVETKVEVARAKVKKVFELSNGSTVAGCKVTKGTILKGYQCFVERPSSKKEKVVGEGKITSLKHAKDEVREAPKGTECGILLEPQVKIEKDDEVVCYKIEKE